MDFRAEPAHHSHFSARDPDGAAMFGAPQRFVEVADEIAQILALDAHALIEGRPIEALGMRFRFAHFGPRDPEGMTVFAQIGVLPEDAPPEVMRRLLEFNALSPAAVSGYYALLPGTDELVCSWRMDISADGYSANDIVAVLADACEYASAVRTAIGDAMQGGFRSTKDDEA